VQVLSDEITLKSIKIHKTSKVDHKGGMSSTTTTPFSLLNAGHHKQTIPKLWSKRRTHQDRKTTEKVFLIQM